MPGGGAVNVDKVERGLRDCAALLVIIVFGLLVAVVFNPCGCGGAPFTSLTGLQNEVAPDAGGEAGGAASGDSGVEGGGKDAPAEAATQDASPCVTDLSNVGAGDFRVAFTLTTTESDGWYALVEQQSTCDQKSSSWSVRIDSAGGIVGSTSDGQRSAGVEAGDSVNDGRPHRVVFARTARALWYSDDGSVRSAYVPDDQALGAMGPLSIGASSCGGSKPLAGAGTIENLCITIGP